MQHLITQTSTYLSNTATVHEELCMLWSSLRSTPQWKLLQWTAWEKITESAYMAIPEITQKAKSGKGQGRSAPRLGMWRDCCAGVTQDRWDGDVWSFLVCHIVRRRANWSPTVFSPCSKSIDVKHLVLAFLQTLIRKPEPNGDWLKSATPVIYRHNEQG